MSEWVLRVGDRGPGVVDIQQRLKKIGHNITRIDGLYDFDTATAVRLFQKNYGLPMTGEVDPATFKKLFDVTDPEDSIGLLLGSDPEEITPRKELENRRIVISVTAKRLWVFDSLNMLAEFPVAVGKKETPTPLGIFRILEKMKNPGGALGTRWIAFTYRRHGIHGTNRPELVGEPVSHGCVRMHNQDIEQVYKMVTLGNVVDVIEGFPKGLKQHKKVVSGPEAGNPRPGAGKPESETPGVDVPKSWPKTHVVRPGDTLYKIAAKHGVTVEELARANGISDPRMLRVGTELRIP